MQKWDAYVCHPQMQTYSCSMCAVILPWHDIRECAPMVPDYFWELWSCTFARRRTRQTDRQSDKPLTFPTKSDWARSSKHYNTKWTFAFDKTISCEDQFWTFAIVLPFGQISSSFCVSLTLLQQCFPMAPRERMSIWTWILLPFESVSWSHLKVHDKCYQDVWFLSWIVHGVMSRCYEGDFCTAMMCLHQNSSSFQMQLQSVSTCQNMKRKDGSGEECH